MPSLPAPLRDPAPMLQRALDEWGGRNDLWVFGYGSLIWRPDFDFAERRAAKVHGWHRALKMWSRVTRGTPDCPGLVFGMLPGGQHPPGVGQKMTRHDIKTAVLHYPDGRTRSLVSVDIATTIDPRTNGQTVATTHHRYANRWGEVLDHNRTLEACCECCEPTTNPRTCSQCGASICQRHVYPWTTSSDGEQNTDYRCYRHRKYRGLLDFLLS